LRQEPMAPNIGLRTATTELDQGDKCPNKMGW
jgi:hypothetical protein